MQSVFAAETAVFVDLKSVRIVLLVFFSVIVSLLAFRAGERNLDSHFFGTSYLNLELSSTFCRMACTSLVVEDLALQSQKKREKKTSPTEVKPFYHIFSLLSRAFL